MKATQSKRLTALIVAVGVNFAWGQTEKRLPDGDPSWRLIARSDLIVKGKLVVPLDSATGKIQLADPDSIGYGWVTLRVQVSEILKGEIEVETEESLKAEKPLLIGPPGSLDSRIAEAIERIKHPKRLLPTNEVWIDYFVDRSKRVGFGRDTLPKVILPPTFFQVKAFHEKEVIAFLSVGEFYFPRYFFTENSPSVIAAAQEKLVRDVKNEINRQKVIAADFPRSELGKTDPLDELVKSLIDHKRGTNTPPCSPPSLIDLEDVQPNATPSIIRIMDDRRPLVSKFIRLPIKEPHCANAALHYPELVVDFLDALLFKMTGEYFGRSWDEKTNRSRAKSLAGWRVYLTYSDYFQKHGRLPDEH